MPGANLDFNKDLNLRSFYDVLKIKLAISKVQENLDYITKQYVSFLISKPTFKKFYKKQLKTLYSLYKAFLPYIFISKRDVKQCLKEIKYNFKSVYKVVKTKKKQKIKFISILKEACS